MKEYLMQLMVFAKNEKQLKEIYNFMKKFEGDVFLSTPTKFSEGKK